MYDVQFVPSDRYLSGHWLEWFAFSPVLSNLSGQPTLSLGCNPGYKLTARGRKNKQKNVNSSRVHVDVMHGHKGIKKHM
jgi:hypothetical protein